MNQKEAKEAMRNKIPVVIIKTQFLLPEEEEYVGKSGLIEMVADDGTFRMLDRWWNYEEGDFETDPNPALTEALEAISWPVRWNENSAEVVDANNDYVLGMEYCIILTPEQMDALGHLIANNLNQLKRK